MSQTAIPLEFEHYLQNQISIGKSPDMNEMIFAYIPGLDASTPINRENGLPELSTWVHQQDIDQVGKLGPNALAYSVVIPGSAAEFTFNAIYLRDKNVPNSCGMVVHKVSETKEAGMASTKSLVQEYTGAANTAAITVDAATWQIDYQARLLGIDEEHRLANLDTYGHTAFIEGFTVTQQADPTKYKVMPGVVYVGGLRAALAQELIQTITTKPNGLYIDVVRQGSSLSIWENKLSITASETELTDYVDGQGEQHYVAKLVTINADGSTTDEQVKGGLALAELKSNAATDDDIDNNATELKHIKLPQLWRVLAAKIVTATLTVRGIVQLSNSYEGTSEAKAVTEKALKDGLAANTSIRHLLYYDHPTGLIETDSQLFDRVDRTSKGKYRLWFANPISTYKVLLGQTGHDFVFSASVRTDQYIDFFSLHSSDNVYYDQSFYVEVIV